ncbi:Sulfotransferase domain protein [Actinomadura rubteroloni]|uniref:Sulfotransferase domain protein n=1 Tax=Actinomadura rubteroloni TaxID=1926885 RepID=A0A2P4UQ05_9ACTN|nr:Sulfotransferase domain protein [Actinomadura rubteroloni]
MFIGGLGRSGSTLLERIVGELPGAFALGEAVHLWQRGVLDGERCGCGATFGECVFWQRVGAEAFGGWDAFDIDAFLELKGSVDRTRFIPSLARRRLAAPLAERVRRHNAVYARLYRAARTAGDARVLIDSSKSASLAHCLRWSDEIDLRIVHVVRDPRAVAHSWAKVVRRPEAADGSAEGEFMARWSPAKTALHWDAQNAGFDVLARRGVPTLRVRYEEFTAEPSGTVRRVARFAGLPDAEPPFEDATTVRLAANHQVAGNPMRFRTGAVELRADEAWKEATGPLHRAVVTAVTAPMLGRYGYSRRIH